MGKQFVGNVNSTDPHQFMKKKADIRVLGRKDL